MKIVWSAPARADLRRIDDWFTKEARPDVAVETLSAIRLRVTFLKRFSRGGRPLPNEHRLLRVAPTPHLIRYRIRDEVVEIIRVHHERENWQLRS